jgi:hypothetical protein
VAISLSLAFLLFRFISLISHPFEQHRRPFLNSYNPNNQARFEFLSEFSVPLFHCSRLPYFNADRGARFADFGKVLFASCCSLTGAVRIRVKNTQIDDSATDCLDDGDDRGENGWNFLI